MGNFEAFSQESSEIKEIDWVQQQVKAELQDLQKESFYSTWEDGKVNYDMEAVKNYLTTIQQKNRSDLTSKNSSAWIMAVQIALEKRGIDVGKVDGIFGAGTRAAVRTFQEKNGITADGLPGKQTIEKLLEWEDKKTEWEDKKTEWEDEKKEWGNWKEEWEDKKPEWGNWKEEWGNWKEEWGDKQSEWEDKEQEWEDKEQEWGDKKKETLTETLEKMDLTKVNVDELKKVYGETIDKNWKGFQEKRNVIEIWGLKFKKWTEGMTGLGYKVDENADWFLFLEVGQYIDGAFTGKWMTVWDDWDVYQWDSVDGSRTWKGKYSRSYWTIYEWERKEDIRDGRGVTTDSDWEKFEGHRERGRKKWRGTTTYPNGDKVSINHEDNDEWKWDYIFSTGEKIYGEWKYLYGWDRECTKKIYNSKEPLVIEISATEENWIIRATSYENTLTFKKDAKNLHLLPETEPPTIISLNDFDKALRAIHLINYAIKMTKDLAKKEEKKFDHFWSNGDSLIIGREKDSIKSFFATTLKKNISQDIGMTAYDLAKYLNANAEAFGLLNAKK